MNVKLVFILLIGLLQILFAQKPYNGAEYRTLDTFLYGRFEVRMRSAPVSGMLASFFTYHEISSISEWNEIDIENLGRYDNQVQFNTITPGQTNHVFEQTVEFNPHNDFHVYAIEWTPNYVAWFVDSVEIYRQTEAHISTLNLPQKLMMNIWPPAYEDWAGKLNPADLPVYAYYDWVRVYAYTPGKNDDFTLLWQDDFDRWDRNRWAKATHTWDGNNSQFVQNNVVFKDGYLILCLTFSSLSGYRGGAIVDEDQSPPYVAKAWSFNDDVWITFSEKVQRQSAETPGNYVIPGATVVSANLLNDQRTVRLSTSGLNPQISYNLVVSNVLDFSGNKISVKLKPINKGLQFPATINWGGNADNNFYGDQIFSPSNAYGREGGTVAVNANVDFANTTDDVLFQSEVRGVNFLRLRVPEGRYRLTFYFAETEKNNAGERIFNVKAENNVVINGLDIFSRAGKNTALQIQVNDVEVTDRCLDIYFEPQVGEPVISALTIEPVSTTVQGKAGKPLPEQPFLKTFPNPVNASAQLQLSLPYSGQVQISVFDLLGRCLLRFPEEWMELGEHRLLLDFSKWGSGVYFCVANVNGRNTAKQKIVVLK